MPSPSTWVTASRQTHSADRLAQQVDGEVGVDEDRVVPVERGAHSVAGIGRMKARCSGVVSSPATSGTRGRIQTVAGPGSTKPPVTNGTPSPCGSRPPGRWRRTRPRPRRPGPAAAAPARPAAGRSPARARPGRGSARRPDRRASLEQLDAPPVAPARHSGTARRERHRLQDLERDPPDAQALARLVALDRARHQRARAGRRAEPRVPGRRASARWDEQLTVELEEGVRHAQLRADREHRLDVVAGEHLEGDHRVRVAIPERRRVGQSRPRRDPRGARTRSIATKSHSPVTE